MEICTDTGSTSGVTAGVTWVNLSMIKGRGKESIHGQMAGSMMEIGLKGNNMELANILMKVEKLKLDDGKMDKKFSDNMQSRLQTEVNRTKVTFVFNSLPRAPYLRANKSICGM